MPDLDAILLNRGLDEIPFGASAADVTTLLGEPDLRLTNEDGDLRLEYDALGLEFEFWREEDDRLGTIGSERASATLGDVPVMGRSEQEVRRLIETVLDAEISEEDDFVDDEGAEVRWLDVDELNVVFWLRDGILERVDWFCDWTDDETPAWPD